MYCKYCGKKIDDDSIYCEYCGKKIRNLPNVINSGQEIISSTNSVNTHKPSSTVEVKNKNGIKKRERDDYTKKEDYSLNNATETHIPHRHDNTKFSFDGENFFTKRKFVLNVIKRFVNSHPNVTLEELERQFPSKIISKERGVVRPLDVVKKWIEEKPDVASRYYLREDQIITLRDGTKVVVHNQWGTRDFPAFLNIAKTLYEITSSHDYEYEIKSSEEQEKEQSIKIAPSLLEKFTKSTIVSDEDLSNTIRDEYGVLYSLDGKRLLKCKNISIRQYSIKAGTKLICDSAFRWCKNLTSINLPNGLESIGDEAFWRCKSLTSIVLPNSLESIGNEAFRFCKNLTSINLPNGLESIGSFAFYGCKDLSYILINCSSNKSEQQILDKFKKLLPSELHNKIKVRYSNQIETDKKSIVITLTSLERFKKH